MKTFIIPFIFIVLMFMSCDDKEYPPHDIRITVIGDASVKGIGTYGWGKECNLSVWANDSNGFLGWFENDKLISKEELYSFNVYKDRHFTAIFTDSLCSVRVYDKYSGSDPGIIADRLNLVKGNHYNFEAVRKGFESFLGWYDEDMNRISRDANIFIKIDRNRTLYRRWQR